MFKEPGSQFAATGGIVSYALEGYSILKLSAIDGEKEWRTSTKLRVFLQKGDLSIPVLIPARLPFPAFSFVQVNPGFLKRIMVWGL